MDTISPQRILVIDDDPFILEVTSLFLKKKGFEVLFTTDPERAFELAEQKQPDLVISDIAMPGLDGVTLLNALKGNKRTQNIPVIFLTGADKAEDIEVGLNAGAQMYLLKPIDWPNAWPKIASLLAAHV